MAFGYRIFQVSIGRPHVPDVRYDFDNAALHSDGAIGLIKDTLRGLSGGADGDRFTYFGIEAIRSGGWVISIDATGGQFGRTRRIKNTVTNVEKSPVSSTDAVVDDLPLILVIPSYGKQGILVAAVEGRSHNAYALQRELNLKLKAKSLTIKLASDLADATAWGSFLDQTDLDVTHVELIQTQVTSQRPTFGQSSKVSRARLLLTISDAATKSSVLTRVKAALTGGGALGLTGVFGMTGLDDGDFDDYRVIYVKDGREKSLTVSSDYPHFIYPLEGKQAPSADELAEASMSDVEHLMANMNINHPTDWFPDGTSLVAL